MQRHITHVLRWLLLICLCAQVTQAAEKKKRPARKAAPNTSFEYRFSDDLKQTADSEARLDQWFRDAKFGAFIHFGVYSSLEGEYQGRGSDFRYSEWIQISAKIPAKEYHQVAAQFNPVEFDADEWAKVFKDAGMRYVVITSKHHDGFALFDSLVSQYNIVDYTAFKRDIIKELSEACHAQGLKFGVYYSNAQDWDEPDAPYLNRRAKLSDIHPDLPVDFKPDMDRYIAKKSLPQVEELMTNYEIDLIWYDTPVSMNMERVKRFSDMVRKHRPDCLINSRIIHRGKGKIEAQYLPYYDYCSIGDKEVPTKKLPLYVESPDSVSSSFGYKTKGKHYYHTEKELIDRLVHTVCAGGNYLLNNGPMGNGRLDPEAMRLYGVLGKWLKANGESIYDTRRNPLSARPEWGDCSASKDGKALYLHVLEWPESGEIELTSLSAVSGATYLASGGRVEYKCNGDTVTFTLPAKPIDEYNTVIKVTLADDPVNREDGTVFPDDVTSLREVGRRLKASQTGLDLVYEYVGVAVQQKGTHVWGTSPVIGKDGKTHLFVAQWPIPENKKERFSGYFKTSEIAQYVGDSPEGPFEFVRMAVRDQNGTFNAPHNPTIQFIDDQYVLCFIVNSNEDRGTQRIIMYCADDPNGEWRPAKGAEPDGTILRRPDNMSIWCHTSVRGVTNPALIKHNGEYRIYFKAAIPDPEKEPSFSNREFGYGVATSKNLEGPYEFHPERLTSEEMELEDVYAFSYDDRVYMMSRDIGATLGGKEGGLLWESEDGIYFPKEKTRRAFESLATYLDEGAMDGAAKYRGSEKGQLERPQLLIVDGEPAYLYVATGLSPEEGCGSCSHAFKLNVKQK